MPESTPHSIPPDFKGINIVNETPPSGPMPEPGGLPAKRIETNDGFVYVPLADYRHLEEQLEAYDAALRCIADKQQVALGIIESNGFVFDSIGKEPGNWQHLAFTLYNEICEIDMWARNTLGIELGEDATSNPAKEPDA